MTQLIALRKLCPAVRRETYLDGGQGGQPPDIVWHGIEPCRPDFSYESRSLAFALDGRRCGCLSGVERDLYIALNAFWEPLNFLIPASPTGRPWRRAVDTALPSPNDAVSPDEGPEIPALHSYRVEARSMLILVSALSSDVLSG